MKKLFLSLVVFGLVVGSAHAYCAHSPSCSKPRKPSSFSSQGEVNNYNSSLRLYKSCIEEYVKTCKREIDDLVQRINKAVNEANNL